MQALKVACLTGLLLCGAGLGGGSSIGMALPAGVIGHSGQNQATCAKHHRGGKYKYSVALRDWPSQVTPNQEVNFSLYGMNRGGREAKGFGFNLSSSGGELSSVNPYTWKLSGELTHTEPARGGKSFKWDGLRWRAPAKEGRYTIFYCVNIVNRNGTNRGDGPPACGAREVDVLR